MTPNVENLRRWIAFASLTFVAGCDNQCQPGISRVAASKPQRSLIGYKVVGKFKDEDGCWIKYQYLFKEGKRRTHSVNAYMRRICCCEYDKVKLASVTQIPKEY